MSMNFMVKRLIHLVIGAGDKQTVLYNSTSINYNTYRYIALTGSYLVRNTSTTHYVIAKKSIVFHSLENATIEFVRCLSRT